MLPQHLEDVVSSSLSAVVSLSPVLCLPLSHSANMSIRTHREKAKEPLVERKPDARSLRLAAKGLYFSPGQVSSRLHIKFCSVPRVFQYTSFVLFCSLQVLSCYNACLHYCASRSTSIAAQVL